jgi:hypothetical protein
LGNAVRKGTNPFTGEAVEFHIDDGLSDSERAAVKRLPLEFHAVGPDADGYYRIKFTDDTYINVGNGPLDGSTPCVGVKLEIEGPVNADVLRFARRLAIEGCMSVGSATDPGIVALVATAQDPRVRERWPHAPVLETDDKFINWVQDNLQIVVSK